MDPNNPADALLFWWTQEKGGRTRDLIKMLGVSRATYEGWRAQGSIPKKYLSQIEDMGFKVNPIDNQSFSFSGRVEEGVTLEVIGGELGVTRERVRQITTTAMKNFARELAKRNIKKEDLF